MEDIRSIAKKYNLFVIEDAAESLGAKYKNKHTGTFGDLGCFSFNGNKVITTGGGGMVVGNDEQKLNYIKFLVNQARDEERGYYHSEIGFNYRMTNIEASVGLVQMRRLDGFLKKKKMFNNIYRDELGKVKNIRFQKEYTHAESSYWFTGIIFEKEINLLSLQNELKEKGIPVRRIFMPVTEFPPYSNYKWTDYGNAGFIYNRGICLPSSTVNSEDDIYSVCKVMREIL